MPEGRDLMSQSSLINAGVVMEWDLTSTGDIKLKFTEYEDGQTPTGRSWSGVSTDKPLFDLLLKVGMITPDIYELGTGVKNMPEQKKGGTHGTKH